MALPSLESFSTSNDATGHEEILKRLRLMGPALIVVEATGGYEQALTLALASQELPIRVVNPRHVRHFANAIGLTAKTDRIDARVLAEFAQRVTPALRTIRSEAQQALLDLSTRRRQVMEMLVAEKNRVKQARGAVRREVADHIKFLEQQVKNVDRELRRLIAESPEWQLQDELIQSVPGVGGGTSASLTAEVPELGAADREANQRLGGCLPVQSRQRSMARPAAHRRRTLRRALRPVHGDFQRLPLQSGAEGDVRATDCQGQALQGGHDGLYAQAPDDSECHCQNR
jgi:transposase